MTRISARRIESLFKNLLLKAIHVLNPNFYYVDRMGLACARGALGAAARRIDPYDTRTWEFSAFSQNGEDGIIDRLTSMILEPNHYFIEIGSAEGLENNSSYLAFVKRYSGLMIEGDWFRSTVTERFMQPLNWGVRHLNLLVTPEMSERLKGECLHLDPDFTSLDIDGNDYYIARSLLDIGLRPKIFCVEYNSAYGPEQCLTIKYDPDFEYLTAHPSRLYYGVSIAGWRVLFESYGYKFVTVEMNGVNAFFVDPGALEDTFLRDLRPIEFRENFLQQAMHQCDWPEQFRLIEDMPYEAIA
jgi:hypothetical protein